MVSGATIVFLETHTVLLAPRSWGDRISAEGTGCDEIPNQFVTVYSN